MATKQEQAAHHAGMSSPVPGVAPPAAPPGPALKRSP
eukprot:CAMPEP_0179139390 /NCGR_PEP_ID=MMETSP0796-20121207/66671_1 /TAXON_ID=73915 /ORGANISM="Pyrodinium bahamense, Strain pbaha01" /LENGTH=36 /DNA_ID= /DNA_START= /DNA_END= /DNA_ORIENTATION=